MLVHSGNILVSGGVVPVSYTHLLRGKLKLLQEESESVQVTPADVPNAQRQFNGLHNSIQQMAREMPSLAMGPQMFFLAISNNLPIFTDELARARKEYDELQKSGCLLYTSGIGQSGDFLCLFEVGRPYPVDESG